MTSKRIAAALFAVLLCADAGARVQPKQFGVPPDPNMPSPRVAAEKCVLPKEAGGARYTAAIYNNVMRRVKADIERSSGVERQLNENAAKTIDMCRARDIPGAQRAYVSCEALQVEAARAERAFDAEPATRKLSAEARAKARKAVLDQFRDAAKSCMSRLPCKIETERDRQELLATYNLFATLRLYGSLTDADMITGKNKVRDPFTRKQKERNIGRKFCGVTFETLRQRCEMDRAKPEALDCSSPDDMVYALRKLEAALGGAATPAGDGGVGGGG